MRCLEECLKRERDEWNDVTVRALKHTVSTSFAAQNIQKENTRILVLPLLLPFGDTLEDLAQLVALRS